RLDQRVDAPVLVEVLRGRRAQQQTANPPLERPGPQPDGDRDGLVHRRADDAEQEEEERETDQDVERGRAAQVRHAATLTPPPDVPAPGSTALTGGTRRH